MEFTLLVSNGPVQVFKCKRAKLLKADESMMLDPKVKRHKHKSGGSDLHLKKDEMKRAKVDKFIKKDALPAGMKRSVDRRAPGSSRELKEELNRAQ